jgi:hypothetical protein
VLSGGLEFIEDGTESRFLCVSVGVGVVVIMGDSRTAAAAAAVVVSKERRSLHLLNHHFRTS